MKNEWNPWAWCWGGRKMRWLYSMLWKDMSAVYLPHSWLSFEQEVGLGFSWGTFQAELPFHLFSMLEGRGCAIALLQLGDGRAKGMEMTGHNQGTRLVFQTYLGIVALRTSRLWYCCIISMLLLIYIQFGWGNMVETWNSFPGLHFPCAPQQGTSVEMT